MQMIEKGTSVVVRLVGPRVTNAFVQAMHPDRRRREINVYGNRERWDHVRHQRNERLWY